MFTGKVVASQVKHLSNTPLYGKLQALGKAGKACQRQTLQLITNIHKLDT